MYHRRIPKKLQSVHYQGPTVEPTKLSEGDKGFIVAIYSGIIIVNTQITSLVRWPIHFAPYIVSQHLYHQFFSCLKI